MNNTITTAQKPFSRNEQNLIIDLLKNGKENRSWLDLAIQHNIKAHGSQSQRSKRANDVWRRYSKLYKITLAADAPLTPGECFVPRRLYYDIETSYNIVKAWRTGYNLNINPEDIIHERAIITIAYKWEGEDEVTVLQWDKGCDKKLLEEFVKVMSKADELVGHNIDKYDTKFILGRCLKHGILGLPKYKSTDTLKIARSQFMLNSNKLDYIAQYLGIGEKTRHRGLAMWDDIILRNDPVAMEEMITYNVQDVYLTEKVYKTLKGYALPKVNHSAVQKDIKHACPECGEVHSSLRKILVSPAGTKTRIMNCNSCQTNFTINDTNYKKYYESESDKG